MVCFRDASLIYSPTPFHGKIPFHGSEIRRKNYLICKIQMMAVHENTLTLSLREKIYFASQPQISSHGKNKKERIQSNHSCATICIFDEQFLSKDFAFVELGFNIYLSYRGLADINKHVSSFKCVNIWYG